MATNAAGFFSTKTNSRLTPGSVVLAPKGTTAPFSCNVWTCDGNVLAFGDGAATVKALTASCNRLWHQSQLC
jgi:hypothetical protein